MDTYDDHLANQMRGWIRQLSEISAELDRIIDRKQQAETLLKRLVGALYNREIDLMQVAMDAELYFTHGG